MGWLTSDVALGFLQLGVAGAILLIVLVVTYFLIKSVIKNNQTALNAQANANEQILDFLEKFKDQDSNLQGTKIDKLLDKIDAVITSNHEQVMKLQEYILINDKDQKNHQKSLDKVEEKITDIQTRVVKIDERTKRYNNNDNKGE